MHMQLWGFIGIEGTLLWCDLIICETFSGSSSSCYKKGGHTWSFYGTVDWSRLETGHTGQRQKLYRHARDTLEGFRGAHGTCVFTFRITLQNQQAEQKSRVVGRDRPPSCG